MYVLERKKILDEYMDIFAMKFSSSYSAKETKMDKNGFFPDFPAVVLSDG